MKYNKFLDFDYVYKGVYLTRLIMFLLMLYIGIFIFAIITGRNVIDGFLITTGFLMFIIICGKIGDMLHLKSIW